MNETVYVADSRWTSDSGRARVIGTLMMALVLILLAVGQARAAANSNPPTPYFVAPLNGSIVSNTVTVIVFAPEYTYWIAELGVDGGNWQLMSTKGDGTLALSWNTGYASNGKHTLTARFTSEIGGPPVAAVSIRVSVQNEELDGQASKLPLPCIKVRPYEVRPVDCAASDDYRAASDDWARTQPLPCIQMIPAFGVKPGDCAPLGTT